MKREILFRAWDKGMQEMVNVRCIQFESDSPYKNPYIIDEYNDVRDLDDVILMQFTGLTNKNGKKIFEGDIVKWDDCSNGKYWRLAVVELKPDIQFNCGLISSMKGIENSTTNTFRYGNFAYQKTELYLEIVGNIFDNSELLNETI